jgi:hypothetical protein
VTLISPAGETVMVARDDYDELAATVRDLTVLPDMARLLGIETLTTPAGVGDREKRRIDLFSTSTPAVRRARRVTTVLLGERSRVPATLVPLTPAQFAEEFRHGEIVQERWSADPDLLARAWGERGDTGWTDRWTCPERSISCTSSPARGRWREGGGQVRPPCANPPCCSRTPTTCITIRSKSGR